jgi:hypothetical protein
MRDELHALCIGSPYICLLFRSFFLFQPSPSDLRIFFLSRFPYLHLYILFISWLLLRVSPAAKVVLVCLEELGSLLSEQLAVGLR